VTDKLLASVSSSSSSSDVTATEMSPVMASRLRDSGYEVWEEDIATTASSRLARGQDKFDLISLLNVLDRTPLPNSLLKAANSLLKPGGKLLVATPLPFRPFYFTANHDVPAERAALHRDPK